MTIWKFVKPRPLKNQMNPGGRWNSNVMWDAREALVPGSVYDRSGRSSAGGYRPHDPMSRITAHSGNVPGMSVPMNMVMNNHYQQKLPPKSKENFQIEYV